MNQTETQREAFELYFETVSEMNGGFLRKKRTEHGYSVPLANDHYSKWKACAAQFQPSVAKDVEILKQYIRDLHNNQSFDFAAAFPTFTHPATKQEDVERVARAIYHQSRLYKDAQGTPVLWENLTEYQKTYNIGLANAAITAMQSNGGK